MSTQLSHYCHLFALDDLGMYAVYNSLWLRVIFIDTKLVPLVEALQQGQEPSSALLRLPPELQDEGRSLLKLLKQERFLDTDSEAKVSALRETIGYLPVSLMYLIVSRNCNLACSYCYLAQSLNPGIKANMSVETAKRAIDFFSSLVLRQGIDKPQIIIYGGEPFVNLTVVEYAVRYATRKIPNIELTINTNGTLINRELAQLLARLNVQVSISLDGKKGDHDKYRVDRAGKPTFDKVISGYRVLKDNSVNVSVSCTINQANVGSLVETTRWFVSELGVDSLGFNLIIGRFDSDAAMLAYAAEASQALVECFKYLRSVGVAEDRMLRRVKAFTEGRVCFNDCGGCGQQIVVTPDNKVGVCQAFMNTGENFVAFDESFDPITNPLWRQWRQRSPFNISACLVCPVLGICGGGCPYNSFLRTGDIMEPDMVHCTHARKALDFMLNDLWQQTRR